MSWVERVETLLSMLKGSSIEELELTEGELTISIQRRPGSLIAVRPQQQGEVAREHIPAPRATIALQEMKTPFTGVYYAASSPASPPFIKVGDVVSVGQTVAMIEAMKVFSEIPSEVSGRIVAISAQNGNVVKKGDTLFQVEPT